MLALALLGLLGIALAVGSDDGDDGAEIETRSDGTPEDDVIQTGDGDDLILAGEGADLVLAEGGEDRVFGADGGDYIVGGEGDDFLRGGDQDDVLAGGEGQDTLYGDAGNDLLDGTEVIDEEGYIDALFDAVRRGDDPEDVDTAPFFDVDADTGESDVLFGGQGNDDILAGSNDVVSTGNGQDIVTVGDWVTPGAPVTITDFNPDEDVIVYAYEGTTAPTAFFGEDDSGATTLEVATSDSETQVIAVLEGVDFLALSNSANLVIRPNSVLF